MYHWKIITDQKESKTEETKISEEWKEFSSAVGESGTEALRGACTAQARASATVSEGKDI